MTSEGRESDAGSDSGGNAYIGRAWLVDAVGEWTDSRARHLLLTGGPGTGKSAAVDHLWGNSGGCAAVHRCRANDRRTCDPVRFAESLAEQFSASLPGFADALMRVSTELSGRQGEVHIEGSALAETVLPGGTVIGVKVAISSVSADEAFDRLVRRPLERLAPDPWPIVVIDALDEALTYRTHRTIAELVLDAVDGVPLRFVVTSRHDKRIVRAIEARADAVSLDLVADAPDPDADLEEYALHRLSAAVGDRTEREALARRLASGGAGNYLYVYHLTQELITGVRDAGALERAPALPADLEGVYEQFLRRELRPIGNTVAEERWRAQFRPLLSVLVAAQEDGFTTAQLAEILDETARTTQDAVQDLGQYLVGAPRGPWTLFHRSFADFLLKGPDPRLDIAEGHERIAAYAFDQWEGAWAGCDDPYYLGHLPHHLMTALEQPDLTRSRARILRDRLYGLACSEEFLAGQRAAAPSREPHLATLALALESSLRVGEYERVTVLALSSARAQIEADALTPMEAALTWGVEAGAAKARTYPENVSLVWHLLIMAAVGSRAPADLPQVVDLVQRSGFGVIDPSWSSSVAALLAPLMPEMEAEGWRAILDIADDELLGYLAFFLSESDSPDLCVFPVLHVQETLVRARAAMEVVSQLALAGEGLDDLHVLCDYVMDSYERHEREGNRHKSYLSVPEVPNSVLVTEAARGRFAAAHAELTDPVHKYRYTLDPAGVLLARIVEAAVSGDDEAASVRELGERLLADGNDPWATLYYARFLFGKGDPRAHQFLDLAIERSDEGFEDDFVWEMYRGHVDPFHGPCDVGFRLALIRTLCSFGRLIEARAQADRIIEADPAEVVRALSYVRQAETDAGRADEILESARQAAAAVPRDLRTQAMLVLVDGDHERLTGAVARSLSRSHRTSMDSVAMSCLAWASHRRGDRERAAFLAGRAREMFTAEPQERRLPRTRDRIVKNLLRARRQDEAIAVLRTPTTHVGSMLLRLRPDVRRDLILGGELEEFELLGGAQGESATPYHSELHAQALTVCHLRAKGDSEGASRVGAAARPGLDTIVEALLEEVEHGPRSYLDPTQSHGSEAEAAYVAVSAVDLGEPELARTSLQIMDAWAGQAQRAAAGWDAFRGYYARDSEFLQEGDAALYRKSLLAAQMAEAHHHAGDTERAKASFAEAEQCASGMTDAHWQANTFKYIAETAARAGWYAELRGLLPSATQVRGAALASVAEILVVKALVGDREAKDEFDALLRSRTLANFDHPDLLSLLAVLSRDPAVEDLLLAAFPGTRASS
ncbi:energy transducer TonB [Streptomyces sp. NPDC048424]|uniref:energy transducer TonB n=1 Tax=Streptomyces sp. NPDC048424 TaxID=3155265 RepID=UPI00343C5173